MNALKTDEEKLRKLINFVKPFELPEMKPPPSRVIKEEPEEKPSIVVKQEQKNAVDEVKSVKELKTAKVEVPAQETAVKLENSVKAASSKL